MMQYITINVCQCMVTYDKYIENNTWVRGNTRFISSVERDISREINLVFPSTHVLFCLLYKKCMHTIITQANKIQTNLL